MAKKNNISFKEFLENVPPNHKQRVGGVTTDCNKKGISFLKPPELDLHCETCGGLRRFVPSQTLPLLIQSADSHAHLDYYCSNCRVSNRRHKFFELLVVPDSGNGTVFCHKMSEFPLFGPPIPNVLLALLGEEGKEGFHKGLFCEQQDLGAGALVYYTRAIESQMDTILAAVLEVSSKLNASPGLIKKLKDANSLEALKKVKLPSSLLIRGKEPLKILYETIGKGQSDAECLKSAQTIRIILTELSKNIDGVRTNPELDEVMADEVMAV